MQCRAIYFDAVGTLIHPEPGAAAVYAQAARRWGSRLNADEIGRRFRAAFAREEQADRAAGWRTSEARELDRWRSIVAGVLDDVADPIACFRDLYEHFSRPQAWRCDSAARALLPELARRGIAVGVASNFDHRLHSVIAGLAPLAGIDRVIVSSEIGWRKPAPAFFDAVCRQACYPPADVLYVGDDFDNDYAGATAAGLQAVLVGDAPSWLP